MRFYRVVLCVCAAEVFTGCAFTSDRDPDSESATAHSCNWRCMVLSLQWPGSFCTSLDNKSNCEIPPTVGYWTIHGLWPQNTGHCCNCWPLFRSHLQEIEVDLSQLWPSLLKRTSSFHFWQEEWIKHGTCAGCEETIGSPFNYFQTAIKLRKLFDVDSLLRSVGIKTSCDTSYKYEEIGDALRPLLGDNFVLQCVTDQHGREAWIQLKINLFRNQTLGCHKHREENLATPGPGHPCAKNTTIFYFPINYERPHNPCD